MISMTFTIPTFVISLPESQDRRDWMEKQLHNLGIINFEFFDAVDGRQMDVANHPEYNGKCRLSAFGRHLKGGELGCTLTHKHLYQKMIDENIELAMILEDDCILPDNAVPILNALQQQKNCFDAVRFLGSKKVTKRGGRKAMDLPHDYALIRMPTSPGGSHGTLITLEGAKKMHAALSPISLPIDAVLGRPYETGLNVFSTIPGLGVANEEKFGTLIGEDRFSKKNELGGIAKTIFPLTRALFKIHETLGKKGFYFATYFKDRKTLKLTS